MTEDFLARFKREMEARDNERMLSDLMHIRAHLALLLKRDPTPDEIASHWLEEQRTILAIQSGEDHVNLTRFKEFVKAFWAERSARPADPLLPE